MTADTNRVLIVTGMSGAGKSTVLRTLEDAGWETVDNLPQALLPRLLAPAGGGAPSATETPADAPAEARPLAIGLGAATRGFDPAGIADAVRAAGGRAALLFLDCSPAELERRYSETRRRHPLASDRPAEDGVARERELLEPLRLAADRLIDTTPLSANELAQEVRDTIAGGGRAGPTLTVTSFGFARGLPRGADLVFDVRFLRNPHWVPALKPGTGLDADVAAYVAGDPAYEDAVGRFEELLLVLLPRYRAEGKSYVTVAVGCTGGRHRSVHVADRIARRLREAGFSPTLQHRDLREAPQDSLEGSPAGT